MLGIDDRVVLPGEVTLAGAALRDDVRGESYPLNQTGVFVVERAGRPLHQVASDLAGAFSLEEDRARQDVLLFAWTLNRALIANVVHARGLWPRLVSWLTLALRLLPAGRLPPTAASRRPLDTQGLGTSLVSAARALAVRGGVLIAVATAMMLQIALLAGAGPGLPVAVGLTTGLGLVLHELGHILALRRVPAALVIAGSRTFVLHASLSAGRRRAVALAGPALPVLVGTALVGLGATTGSAVIGMAALPLAGHGLALTAIGGDGRVACGT